MPIYLVRWPDLSVALVRARTREDLSWILDEVADPDSCEVKQYNGPLYIALDLDVQYEFFDSEPSSNVDYMLIKDVSECTEYPSFRLSDADGDTGYDMRQEIIKFAFPHYASYLSDKEMEEVSTDVAEKACKDSLHKELDRMSRHRGKSGVVQLRQ